MTIISFMSLQSSQSKRNNFHSLNFWAWVQKKKKKITSLYIKLRIGGLLKWYSWCFKKLILFKFSFTSPEP